MALSTFEPQVHKVTGGLEPPRIPLTGRVRCPLRHVTARPRGDSNSRFPDLRSRALPNSGFADEVDGPSTPELLATGPEAEAVGLEPTQPLGWTP
jgi:hypothetical protein